MATHLSAADSLKDEDMAFTAGQIRIFRETVDLVRKAGIDPGKIHAANSGAVCFHEDSYFDIVRPGIMLYGYSPASARPAEKRFGPVTRPIMELVSTVTLIKKIKAGESVSYNRTWTAKEDTYIGNLPVGYADGLPRLLSNKYNVMIRGKKYPLIGNICMDQCMVNLGNDCEVRRWDEAVIFGPGFTDARDIADITGTIPYEILCNINRRVPRVYTEN